MSHNSNTDSSCTNSRILNFYRPSKKSSDTICDREYICVIQHGIMSASHSKVVVDHEGDLSPS